MKLRLLRIAIVGVLSVASFGAAAQATPASRFTAIDPASVVATRLPPGIDATPVTIVVVLAGDPVAVVQGNAGHKLNSGEKQAIKGSLANAQAAVAAQITAAGGTILGTFQSAVNGIKVQIAANKVNALRSISGVVDIKSVNRYDRENVIGVPRIQAPAVWAGIPSFRGEGIKIASIDTGIDYTHKNFGGPGTVAAYNLAHDGGAETLPANPALFGPAAPKVKGGIDLVGDSYQADPNTAGYQPIPHPDSNPLDCNTDVGHGSHTSGTMAGYGVLSDGSTFHGPYDATTYGNSFRIGPGVAPLADLYAIRVFGCHGSTDVVVEAIDWAIDHDMDVINMSLGSSYGTADSADALASDNAMKAGIVVVASAGNSNDLRYIVGSPSTSNRAISVAATTTPAVIDFGNVALPAVAADNTTRTITAIDANGAPFGTITAPVKVVRNSTGGVDLGCSVAAFQANGGVVGKIAVVNRGTCGRVSKAIYGQQAGAAVVIMVNNSASLPPYEGLIFQNPDTGAYYTVTIPFFGVVGTTGSATSDGSRLVQRDGQTITITKGTPQTSGIASFSSGGPRSGDSFLKPDISAPGSPIISTFSGSGDLQESLSGTSMAAPHVSGAAALAIQAHPLWKPQAIKAAILNSGDPSAIAGYATHTAGTGFVSAASAAHTQVTASADDQATTLNFGLVEMKSDFSGSGQIKLHNDGSTAATFNVSVTNKQGSPHTVTLDKAQVTVPAHSDANVKASLAAPVVTIGDSTAFRDIAGLVTFTPASASDNGGIVLRVPYYMVPRVRSNVSASLDKNLKKGDTSGSIIVQNDKKSPIAATADFYSWGLDGTGKAHNKNNPVVNLAAAGVQSSPFSATEQFLVFAVTTQEGWSSPSEREFDVLIDTNGDGNPDYAVIAVDIGLITTGAFDGRIAVEVINLATGASSIDFLAVTSTDTSTMLIPVRSSRLGLSAAHPRFTYTVNAFNVVGTEQDSFGGVAGYNAFSSAISDAQFATLNPNSSQSLPFTVNLTEYALTPALGMMVVTPDNQNGQSEANLVKITVK